MKNYVLKESCRVSGCPEYHYVNCVSSKERAERGSKPSTYACDRHSIVATAGLLRADREVAALAVLAPQLAETLKSVRSTLMGLLENKASHTTEGVTGYVHFMRIEIDKALAEAKKAGA